MLTLRQFQILSACANGPHLFYAPFAMVNYGGQVFDGTRDPGDDSYLRDDYTGARYENDGNFTVAVPGREIAEDLLLLIRGGFVHACKFTIGVHSGDERGVLPPEELDTELRAYDDYDCLTYGDHYDAFGGYGPHEFEITESGLAELNHPQCDEYRRQLRWDE